MAVLLSEELRECSRDYTKIEKMKARGEKLVIVSMSPQSQETKERELFWTNLN